jgi:hypothetical protein
VAADDLDLDAASLRLEIAAGIGASGRAVDIRAGQLQANAGGGELARSTS